MDRRSFIKSVKNWDAVSVESALVDDPRLSRYADQTGRTPLHHCAEVNPKKVHLDVADSIKTAKALLSAGADVNATRIIMDEGKPFYASPLWYAVAWGKNFELARFLLENGAVPDDNATRSAIWDEDLRMAELLRLHGADIDAHLPDGTPLLQNVKSKRFRLISWLVSHGANINFQDERGYTALRYAVESRHTLAQVEELLRCGADARLEAKDGHTPASRAKSLGRPRLVPILEHFPSTSN
jgi:ankyrin repeat/SAM/basic leucine zipper domain-containing protein 1